MLHEMAHLYNLIHEIKDVSNNGYYHNKKFKATAEAHGLHIEHHGTYGWTVTTLTEKKPPNGWPSSRVWRISPPAVRPPSRSR